MYRHCIFCSAALGENQTLERFPVGVQIAFDSDKGRLWCICVRCRRWNLASIDERWEAVEDAERSFRSASVRAHHENIGIARLPAGMLLVRVGLALPVELAAWRYGTELQRRRRQHGIRQIVNAITAVAVGVWLPSTFTQGRRVILASNGRPLRLAQLAGAEFRRGLDGIRFDLQTRERWFGSVPRVSLGAGKAEAVLGRVLTAVNHRGADSHLLEVALSKLAHAGTAERYLYRPGGSDAEGAEGWSLKLCRWRDGWCLAKAGEKGRYAYPAALEEPLTLAMEMALHEALEREALAGDLAQLRLAWREAEEIAAIADAL